MFGWLKKKKDKEEDRSYHDPLDTGLSDLVAGAFLDYDFKTWEVRKVFEYDWGHDYFTVEYQIETAYEKYFLHVAEGDSELECVLSQKINVYDIEGNVVDHIMNSKNESPPMQITYQGETFFRDSEDMGHYRNVESDNWFELISWTYYNRAKDTQICIERWGEEDFEASHGQVLSSFEFSNIIMP